MKRSLSPGVRGVLCAVFGGVFWGASGTCAEYLFTAHSVSPLWLAAFRMLSTSLIVTSLAFWRRGAECLAMLRDKGSLLRLAVYGVFGLMLCQFSYLVGISYANAATVTVLQTLSMAVLMLINCLRQRRRPTAPEALALFLALGGTFLLATGGRPGQLTVSPPGLFWGLAAAGAVVVYSLVPLPLLRRYDRQSVVGLGMRFAAVGLNLPGWGLEIPAGLPLSAWLAVGGTVLLGSVLSFSLIAQSIADIGPARCAMLASSEPLSATLFGALFLHNTFTAADLWGFAAIISTIFLLSWPQKPGAA